MKYPIEFNLKKTAEENFAELLWVKRVDRLLQETFKGGKLKNFGTHFNVGFSGWEGLTQEQINKKLQEVAPADAAQQSD